LKENNREYSLRNNGRKGNGKFRSESVKENTPGPYFFLNRKKKIEREEYRDGIGEFKLTGSLTVII